MTEMVAFAAFAFAAFTFGGTGLQTGASSAPSSATSSDPSTPQDLPTTPAFRARFEPIHRALLTGLITSVGRKSDTPPTFEYEGPRSTRFAIFPGSGLFKTSQRWVMASELVRTSRLYARTLAAIRPEWIEHTAEHLVKRTHHDPYWDPSRAGGQVMAFERVTLFGLELVKRRLVHFGPIEPATARGLFIHHALVGGEYITDAEWFDHNRRLVQRVAEMENKARRRGLLVDSARRYAFYDDRIGPEVVSAATFEQWRRRAEQRNPRILFMGVADLLDPGSALPEAADFPDSLTAQSVFGEPIRLHVDYAFEPGAPRDGLTVTLTSSQVERFDPRPLEWLVPGLLAEKIAELIRTLPKSLRAAFVPAPRFAEQCVEALTFGKGDLLEELARKLSTLSSASGGAGGGTVVTPDLFKPDELPDHLRVNYRVVADADPAHVVAESRSFAEIRRKLAVRVRDALASLPQGRFNRDGIVAWDFLSFGDDPPDAAIPDSILVDAHLLGRAPLPLHKTKPADAEHTRSGASPAPPPIQAFPALVEPHRRALHTHTPPPKAVAIRLFDTPEKAARAMHRGLRRLFIIQLETPIASLIEHTPGVDRLTLAYATLGTRAQLRAELEDLVGLRAFDDIAIAGSGASAQPARSTLWSKGPIRTKAAFDEALEIGWNRLGAAADEVLTTVRDTLAAYQQIAPRIGTTGEPWQGPKAWTSSIADMREQLHALVYPGFLTATPWKWLRQYPRYLQALSIRLEKLAAAPALHSPHAAAAALADGHARDQRALEQVLPFWRAWREADAAARAPSAPDLGEEPELDEFRWMVEEFRVSVFAQNLQTLVPVSSKRLLAQWDKARTARERLVATLGA